MKKDNFDLMMGILDRAESMDLMGHDRLTLAMDLDFATDIFNLDLEGLLKADDYNFSHDIVGIQNHVNRETMMFEDCFVPRYSRSV